MAQTDPTRRICIAGSRDYPLLFLVKAFISALDLDWEIIVGGARGVDLVAERCAHEFGHSVMVFKPDWTKGPKAGPLRNVEMVTMAQRVACFWDKESKGTAHTIHEAQKQGKPIVVFGPDGDTILDRKAWDYERTD